MLHHLHCHEVICYGLQHKTALITLLTNYVMIKQRFGNAHVILIPMPVLYYLSCTDDGLVRRFPLAHLVLFYLIFESFFFLAVCQCAKLIIICSQPEKHLASIKYTASVLFYTASYLLPQIPHLFIYL